MSTGKPSANDNQAAVRSYVPAPLFLPAFPDAQRVRGKTIIPGGGLRQRWKDRSGVIYEWDYQHGRVERYDRRGKHLGEFDPNTGSRTKPPNSALSGRTMNAVVKLTGYDKGTELLATVMTVPSWLVPFARTVAGVPESDPGVAAMYPLTVRQAQEIAAEAGLPLDPARFDYCLEAIAENERSWVRNA